MADGARLAGVLGWPVAHSLSPLLHGYWLRQYGISGRYLAMPVRPEDLAASIEDMRKGFAGCNLTIPHKEAVIPLLDEVDELGRAIGAVNTVVVKGGRLYGTNTDVYGFSENMRPHISRKNKAVVLGAGGAARAVCRALLDEGFARIVIVNRTLEKAQSLAQHFGERFSAAPWEEREDILRDADLLVNATSLGLENQPELAIDLAALPASAVVTDTIYKPLETRLLAQARARGLAAIDGLGMLIHQAVPGFAAWFGVTPQVTPELREYLIGGTK
jgi:shikimate dehydrogenase